MVQPQASQPLAIGTAKTNRTWHPSHTRRRITHFRDGAETEIAAANFPSKCTPADLEEEHVSS